MLKNRTSIAHTPSKKILILNLKGGVGKSTFAVNLASKLCLAKYGVELLDSDKQGSSFAWAKGIEQVATQHINFTYKSYSEIATSVKVNRHSHFILIDSPANFDDSHLKKYLMLTDYVIIPLQPSPVDLHASLPFIEKVMASLALVKKDIKVGFVVNRCHEGNPQVQKVLTLLRHFRQYDTLGIMSDSHLYQEPFLHKELLDIQLDEKLWGHVLSWLKPHTEQQNVTRLMANKRPPAKKPTQGYQSLLNRWKKRS